MSTPDRAENPRPDARASALSIERRADGVAILRMDVPGEAVNVLRPDFAIEVKAAFDELERDPEVRALVFTSGKPGSFIAGADLTMIRAVRSDEDATELSRRGQETMDAIERFPKPVVAAIDGPCLGGGLEVALACHARVATSHRKTKLGLPEVQLGVLPGAGGTQRLPRLVGVRAALDLLLTGKQLDAARAKRIGLVDEVVPESILLDVAIATAARLADGHRDRRKPLERVKAWLSPKTLPDRALAGNPMGRKVLFDRALEALRKKTRGNYPAPEHILTCVRVGLEKGFAAGLEVERRLFGELVVSPEAAALMSLFFATNALKKDLGVEDAEVKPRPVRKVGMLGAGLMGGGIAYVTSALAETPVRLKDRDDDGVLRGLRYLGELVEERRARRRITPEEAARLLSRVTGTTSYAGFADCDIVIEAVFEDLALKHRVLREVEAACPPQTIFASNTSSLPIRRVAEASAHPERVIGMHYFSPVHKMPLLEVIMTERTAPWVTATCVALGQKQGKHVIVVRDGVGFYTTRILAPFLNEAAHLLAEGVAIDRIDRALVDFGFPIGPLKLSDEVGLDVGAKVSKILLEAFGERLAPPPSLARLLEDGRHGRKNGRGFYLYEGTKKPGREADPSVYSLIGVTPSQTMAPTDIAERCALQLVNEAARCLDEGILRSPRDGDVGAVFGIGFPPFLGGPFRWVDAQGAREVVRKLEQHRDRLGSPRFEPAQLLVRMAADDSRFYPADASDSQ